MMDRRPLIKTLIEDLSAAPLRHRAKEYAGAKELYAAAREKSALLYAERAAGKDNKQARIQADLRKHEAGQLVSAIERERREIAGAIENDLQAVMNPETPAERVEAIEARFADV